MLIYLLADNSCPFHVAAGAWSWENQQKALSYVGTRGVVSPFPLGVASLLTD